MPRKAPPSSAPKATPKPKKPVTHEEPTPRDIAPTRTSSWLLLSPMVALLAIGIGAAAGGTCMAVGCFSFLQDAPLPPVPTMPVRFSPIAMRTPTPTPSPTSSPSDTLWGDFIPNTSEGFDPLATTKNDTLPSTVDLAVPFTAQAPLGGTWDDLHNDACEEASALMVEGFVKQKGVMAKQATDKAIREMVAWESSNGYEYDVTAKELADIFGKYFTLSAKAYAGTDVTINAIKRLLSAGYPVIVPAAGKLLGNPYFTPPGPDYHMLVIVGYDADGFIVNDPGTRRGEKYHYSFDTLYGAIHDWTGDKKTVPEGQKAMVVVAKN